MVLVVLVMLVVLVLAEEKKMETVRKIKAAWVVQTNSTQLSQKKVRNSMFTFSSP